MREYSGDFTSRFSGNSFEATSEDESDPLQTSFRQVIRLKSEPVVLMQSSGGVCLIVRQDVGQWLQ